MTEESPRTSWLSKTSLDTQLEKLKKMFKVQDLPFGQEVKKIREILTPEILASGEFSQPLENWINSKEFIDLHPKQKFGLLFYLFLELGYSKNKDVFLEYISSDQFPFYSRFSILSLFHKDNKSVRDISLAFRETFKSQEEAFANAWDLFLSQFPVDEQKSLNKCLKIFFTIRAPLSS